MLYDKMHHSELWQNLPCLILRGSPWLWSSSNCDVALSTKTCPKLVIIVTDLMLLGIDSSAIAMFAKFEALERISWHWCMSSQSWSDFPGHVKRDRLPICQCLLSPLMTTTASSSEGHKLHGDFCSSHSMMSISKKNMRRAWTNVTGYESRRI